MTRRRPAHLGLLATLAALVTLDAAAQAPAAAPGAVLPGEWMLPASSTDTWRALDGALAGLGLQVNRREERFGAIVTRFLDLPSAPFGSVEDAGLPPVPARSRVEVHLHVMRGLEPARLAIGVVTETDTGAAMTRRGRATHAERHFGNVVLRTRVLNEIEARLGVRAEPLAATPAGRAAQAVRLLPAGLEGGCGVREAAHGDKQVKVERAPARTGYAVAPVYPRGALEHGSEATVRVQAELTEHGTLEQLALTGTQTTGDDFARAALGAFALWRFTPMIQAGCPVRAHITLGSRFTAP